MPRIRKKTFSDYIAGNISVNALLSFIFGTTFLSVMLAFAGWFPNPTEFQYFVFLTVLALAGAGIGAVLPGFLNIRYKNYVRAGGALGVFVLIFTSSPKIAQHVVRYEEPASSPEPVALNFLSVADKGDIGALLALFDKDVQPTNGDTASQMAVVYENSRKPLGVTEARQIVGMQTAKAPPQLPLGLYRSLAYRTKFKNDKSCRMEAITLRATDDLQWKVFNYSISPTQVDCPGGSNG